MDQVFSPGSLEAVLADLITQCRMVLGNELVSVVLFGSYAQGVASPESDVDVLVIAQKLPEKDEEYERVIDDIEIPLLKKYHVCVEIILTGMESVQKSAESGNPLFYGMYTGYSVLFDPQGFFQECMDTVRHRVREEKPIYIDRRRRWDLAEI